jgi:hypothetical protein
MITAKNLTPWIDLMSSGESTRDVRERQLRMRENEVRKPERS